VSEREERAGKETEGGTALTRGQALGALAAGGAVGGAAALAVGLGVRVPERPRLATRLPVRHRRGALPVEDVASDGWRKAPPILVALQPQRLVTPTLEQGDIDRLTVRALHNGRELAFLLEWNDAHPDDTEGIGSFADSVAVQIPSAESPTPPSIMMGGAGQPVHVLQWRASWQRDLAGRVGVDETHPNVIRDVGPEELLGAEAARPYAAARAVGNPLAAAERTTSVEELVAEGFGSLTPLEAQRARGSGAHADGRWRVAIGLPLDRGDTGAALAPGSAWPAAFAVWLGGRGNRGGRKHFSDWVLCELEAP
jgi:hypothetical protein